MTNHTTPNSSFLETAWKPPDSRKPATRTRLQLFSEHAARALLCYRVKEEALRPNLTTTRMSSKALTTNAKIIGANSNQAF